MNMNRKRFVIVFLIFIMGSNFFSAFSQEVAGPIAQRKISKPFKGIVSNKSKRIILGSTVPISGGLYRLGKDLLNGSNIVFNEVNKKGIHGYKIKYIVRDDQYDQTKIKSNVDSLAKQTAILFNTFSSDVLSAIGEKNINNWLVLFPDAGISDFRSSEYSSLFYFRPSTAQEIKVLISYAVNVLFKRRIAIFYEDSLWGIDGFNYAKTYISKRKRQKVSLVCSARYARNTVNVEEAAEEIAKSAPDVVICISHYRPTYSVIKRMLNLGQQKTSFLGVSETSLIQEYLKKSRGVNLITTSIVPNPWKSSFPIAKEYRQSMKRNSPNYKLSPISFEGFINASLLCKSLQNITPPITKEKIIASLESMKNFNFKGLKINFDSASRSLSQTVWLNTGKDVSWKGFAVKPERRKDAKVGEVL